MINGTGIVNASSAGSGNSPPEFPKKQPRIPKMENADGGILETNDSTRRQDSINRARTTGTRGLTQSKKMRACAHLNIVLHSLNQGYALAHLYNDPLTADFRRIIELVEPLTKEFEIGINDLTPDEINQCRGKSGAIAVSKLTQVLSYKNCNTKRGRNA